MLIWISGPTGAGKTSLCQIFRTCGYGTVEEKVPQSTFADFKLDPIRHCAALQEQIMRSRFEAWQKLADSSRVVFDRSIDEDIHVFCRMHFELGYLTDNEFRTLKDVASQLQRAIPNPDLIVFMRPPESVLSSRVAGDGYPLPIVDNLNRQISLYGRWLETRAEEIISLDNSKCRLETIQRVFRKEMP
jgi:deoxyadenosine/deoxycytidine kinase